MILGIIIGVAIGFFFQPQIKQGIHKVAGLLKDRNNHSDRY